MSNSYKKGRVYEDYLAEQYGKRQPGSGCHYAAKEDILGEKEFSDLLIQAKNASGQKSYSVQLKDLKALKMNSCRIGRTGVMFVNFGENEEYVIMPKRDFDYQFTKESENNGC